jgi:hypothetical protein
MAAIGLVTVDSRYLQQLLHLCTQLQHENARLVSENGKIKQDHQVLADALTVAHTREQAFRKQLISVKAEVICLRETQTKLNENNMTWIKEILTGLMPDSDVEGSGALSAAQYTFQLNRQEYMRMVKAYTTLCMYSK